MTLEPESRLRVLFTFFLGNSGILYCEREKVNEASVAFLNSISIVSIWSKNIEIEKQIYMIFYMKMFEKDKMVINSLFLRTIR